LKNVVLSQKSGFKGRISPIVKTYSEEVLAELEWFDNGDMVVCIISSFKDQFAC